MEKLQCLTWKKIGRVKNQGKDSLAHIAFLKRCLGLKRENILEFSQIQTWFYRRHYENGREKLGDWGRC